MTVPLERTSHLVLTLEAVLGLEDTASELHDPAALVRSLGLEDYRAGFLEQLECCLPETPEEDIGLPVQEIVEHVEPGHGREVRINNARSYEFGELGNRAVLSFHTVKNLGPLREEFLVGLILDCHSRINIPTPVIERLGSVILRPYRAHILGDAVVNRRIHIEHRNNHVGNLHTGVIDVIAGFHVVVQLAECPHNRVAYNSVPEVADVHGLVGIHIGMLDEDFLIAAHVRAAEVPTLFHHPVHDGLDVSRVVDLEVQIARRGDRYLLYVRQLCLRKEVLDFLRDLHGARFCTLACARQTAVESRRTRAWEAR